MSNKWRTVLRVLWAATLTVIILGSLAPPSSAPVTLLDRLGVDDKALHFVLYGLLAFLPVLHEGRRGVGGRLAAAILLALAMECFQGAVGRTPDAADVLASEWGVACGALLGLWLRLELVSAGTYP